MTTRIVSQVILRDPTDESVQLSAVKAEIARQRKIFMAQEEKAIDTIRRELNANVAYVKQIRSSRDRLREEDLKRMSAVKKEPLIVNILRQIGEFFVLLWALFWLAGEAVGLWRLPADERKHVKPTRLFWTIYIILGTALTWYIWYRGFIKLILWVRVLTR